MDILLLAASHASVTLAACAAPGQSFTQPSIPCGPCGSTTTDAGVEPLNLRVWMEVVALVVRRRLWSLGFELQGFPLR